MQDLLGAVEERQVYGERLLTLTENSVSRPLTDLQARILVGNADRLETLGLRLRPQIDGSILLTASSWVGITRFHADQDAVMVEVLPKIGQAAFFQMLQVARQDAELLPTRVEIDIDGCTPAEVFLLYFAREVERFLETSRFRTYTIAQEFELPRAKGKFLLQPYVTRSLARGRSERLPHQFLDFSPNNVENQIIAYAVYLAIQIVTTTPLRHRDRLVKSLRGSLARLNMVTIRRMTRTEVANLRYTRLNRHFREIHALCRVLVENASVALSGRKLPFPGFTFRMSDLFERYVGALFRHAFGPAFTSDKDALTFPLNAYNKEIELDGLLKLPNCRVVVECKYKLLGELATDPEEDTIDVEGLRIRTADVYQTAAYASHFSIRANAAILVFPKWNPRLPAVKVFPPIKSLGWPPGDVRVGTEVHIMSVDLTAPPHELVRNIKEMLPPTLPRVA